MSYLALARKWRPRTFADVVGQSHVVRALSNALTADRVHHAYLFAGTRGVGKTTIARILAKALNCESGVTAEPCGICNACVGVDEGRFVDLIEVDAASRTGVDDTRDLLENVQYTPSGGRFKVYLIDEVHMLSRQSFNALLKTLEEPPPHVKFLFATTDPQKLPVTVLSRCLQFNLKRLSSRQILDRMQAICDAEGVKTDAGALTRLARAAAGSMRDGLSLLDQAIAFGDGKLEDDEVAAMLGTMDRHRIVELIDAIVDGSGAALIAKVRALDELVPDYENVLDELATTFQRIAVVQIAGADALEDEEDNIDDLVRLADRIEPELAQLLYQIALTSRRDLALAPDGRLGFEMALLRMLTFLPASAPSSEPGAPVPARKAPGRAPQSRSTRAGARRRTESSSQPAHAGDAEPAADVGPPVADDGGRSAGPISADEIGDWVAFVGTLTLDGAARQLAENVALDSVSPFELQLSIERRNEHLLTEQLQERLRGAIHERVGEGVRIHYTVIDESQDTVAARSAEERARRVRAAAQAIEGDPGVQGVLDAFGAEIVTDSVRPGSAETRK